MNRFSQSVCIYLLIAVVVIIRGVISVRAAVIITLCVAIFIFVLGIRKAQNPLEAITRKMNGEEVPPIDLRLNFHHDRNHIPFSVRCSRRPIRDDEREMVRYVLKKFMENDLDQEVEILNMIVLEAWILRPWLLSAKCIT
jgi:hypothetical protein